MAKDFDFYPSGKTSPNLVTLLESHSVISCPYPFTLFPSYSIWQCDQIGLFLEFNGDYYFNKSSPNDWQLFGLFWKTSLLCNYYCIFILATVGKIWATFYSNIQSHPPNYYPHSDIPSTSYVSNGVNLFIVDDILIRGFRCAPPTKYFAINFLALIQDLFLNPNL